MFRCGEARHSGHVRDTETCQRNKIISTVTRQGTRLTYRCHCAVCVCVLLSVNVQGVRASSGGEDGVSAEHREQSGRGLRWVLLSVPARCAAKYYCRQLHVRAARVRAERHAGDLHTPGTGRGGTLHTTLVTSCLARNNNTNHEYFIRNCLQNYIKLANGSSLVGQLALPSTNQIITEI